MRCARRITALFQFRGQAQASARSQAIFGPTVLGRKCACVGAPSGGWGQTLHLAGRSRSRDALTRPVRMALYLVRRTAHEVHVRRVQPNVDSTSASMCGTMFRRLRRISPRSRWPLLGLSSTVTLLFTDLEASTQLWEQGRERGVADAHTPGRTGACIATDRHRWVATLACGYCQSARSSVRRPRVLSPSRLSFPTLGLGYLPRSVSRRGIVRRSE
jgi:hypothetical protein